MNRVVRQNGNSIVSNDIIDDNLKKYKERKLSEKEEREIINKAKLSFYNKVDCDKQKLYFEYYLESYPIFKEEYEKVVYEIEKKEKEISLLDESSKECQIETLKNAREELAKLEKKRVRLLNQAINHSKEIRNDFIANNQRFVVSFLKKYASSISIYEDLYMEGNLGLLKALEEFDIEKDTKFFTYAAWWIRLKMSEYVEDKDRLIRLPYNIIIKLKKIIQEKEAFESTNYGTITLKQLSEITGLKEDDLKFLMRIYWQYTSEISLNQRMNLDSEEELGNYIPDEYDSYEQIDNQIEYEYWIRLIEKMDLPVKTVEVLKMRYGLDDGIPKTLQEVGDELNISKERVSKIEYFGLKRIKNDPSIKFNRHNHF